jgi:hypothetical protein
MCYVPSRFMSVGVVFAMTDMRFNRPVKILFDKLGRMRNVKSVREAAECLRSDVWPDHSAPMRDMAARALLGATEGQVTAREAREAFADAALEARILVVGPGHISPGVPRVRTHKLSERLG